MQIAVIIPVYNAAAFLKKAVDSALQQSAVKEVILIEDHSSDNSLTVCQAICQKHSKVKLFRHKDGQNHGPGASRNLGIQKAKTPYIAFLDADDYYLPNRFNTAIQFFKATTKIDGVYEAIGTDFYTTLGQQKYIDQGNLRITTMTKKIKPNHLFETFIIGDCGYFHLNGLLVKKELLLKCGLFDESLIQAEDTDLILKMSLKGQLIPGNLKEPVAMRGVHNNSIFDTEKAIPYRHKFNQKWFRRMLENNWSSTINRVLLKRKLVYHPLIRKYQHIPLIRKVLKLILFIILIFRHPKLLFKII